MRTVLGRGGVRAACFAVVLVLAPAAIAQPTTAEPEHTDVAPGATEGASPASPAPASDAATKTPEGSSPSATDLETARQVEAQGLRYRVEVEAPEPLRGVLRKSLDLVRWQDYPNMTPALLARLASEAREQAETAARSEGYFSAVATSAVERTNGDAVVRIRVDLGPPTRVTSVDIQLTGPVMESDPEGEARLRQIVERWSLVKGERFRQEAWEAAKRSAVAALAEKRYAAARIARSEARIDPETHTAALSVVLDSGPPFRFGPIEMTGFSRYQSDFARRVSPIKPGDPYDEDQVALFQRRLLETGYFATVQVGIDADPALADAAPVRVNVVESKPRRIDAGAGYSTNTGLRANAEYSDFDFLGTNWRWRNSLIVENILQSISTTFDSPPLDKASWNSISARARRKDVEGELSEDWAVAVSHSWGYDARWPSFVSLGFVDERLTVNDVTSHNYATFLGYRAVYRHTDDILLPRRGVLATFELGGAPPAVSARAFVRARTQATMLIPLSRDHDLTLRAELGAVSSDSTDGIPSVFLYRTGGDETVRGYAYESLGVKRGNAVTGGRFLAVASVEYTHWLTERWGAAAFVDAGNAANTISALSPALGYGVGARLRTPVGPVRADIAYGERDRAFRFHFSVGFRF